MSIAVYATSRGLDCLRMVGADFHLLEGVEERELKRAVVGGLERYEVLLIEEELYERVKGAIRLKMEELKKPPLIVVIPSIQKPRTRRLNELYKLLSVAVGVRLRWVK